MLHEILAAYCGVEPDSIRIERTELGKPYTAPAGGVDVRFNVTHCGGLALVALTAGCDVGVDVERLRAVHHPERILARILGPREAEDWKQLDPEARGAEFFRAWTRLEAVAKLRGDGVWRTLKEGGFRSTPGLRLIDLQPCDGYLGALAVRTKDEIRVREKQFKVQGSRF